MTSNVDQELYPDELPTRPAAPVTMNMLSFASRVDRLTELAIERLRCCPDDDALACAVRDLEQVRALTAGVLR